MTIDSRMSYDTSYVKSRKKALRQLKVNNAQQLEMETKKMEDRIRALKEQMVREKEEREKLGGTRWASGKTGPLTSHAQDVLKKKGSKAEKPQRKIKILSDEPLQSYIKKPTPRMQPSEGTFGPLGCGQCEKTKAAMVCIECSEKYCVSCFMGFHQKGALRKHCTKTIEQYEKEQSQQKELYTNNNIRYTRPEDAASSRVIRVTSHAQTNSSETGDPPKQRGGSLLQGTYSEEESAKSFAEALKAWRNAGQEEKVWTNPADNKASHCDSSTAPEPTKPLELKVNFGSNKSLSYLDRMLLKKHHNNSKVTHQPPPSRETKNDAAGLLPSEMEDSHRSPRLDTNELGVNYREIFQSLGTSSTRQNIQANGAVFANHSKNAVIIEEVNEEDQFTADESAACIVEESAPKVPSAQVRPTSRQGRVSIMCMTPTGNFVPDTDTVLLEDVSSVSSESNSPVTKSTPMAKEGGRVNIQSKIRPGKTRIWTPEPCFVGLSEFFLAGVQGDPSSGRKSQSKVRSVSPSIVSISPDKISQSLLTQNVWRPEESVCPSKEGEDVKTNEAECNRTARIESPQPIIPLVTEPALLDYTVDRPDSRSTSLPTQFENDTEFGDHKQIHDFGIVDFLKAPPCLPAGFADYSQVHRVSTVSPLTLSPNPPLFHWSDDSDDEFLEHICSGVNKDDEKEDQEADDRATLIDLAWELASTTGRLTQCDFDDEEGEGEEDFDMDSIESNDQGSGLSSSEDDMSGETYSANVERSVKKDENTLAQEEVHALK